MVEVIRKQRKSPVLTPSSIPCLRRLPTINITQGCALGCTYCYIKGYRDYPGPHRIVLFDNTAQLVREELARKRKPPTRVYFSPSSDAFQFPPEVQEVTYDAMRVLLDAGVEVSFLTKGFVSKQFLELFGKRPALVHAQIGVTSLNQKLWHMFEPCTAQPARRVDTIRALAEGGVKVTVRLDPLIPDVTDTTSSLASLLEQLRAAGITFCAASYLFLRPAYEERVARQLKGLGVGSLRPQEWTYQQFTDGCGGGRCIGEQERRERFEGLALLGRQCGMTIAPCRCKNPSLARGNCHIAGPPSPAGEQSARQLRLQF